MKIRTTVVLFVVFIGGLLGLYWAESARIPTERDRRRTAGRVLPELIDTAPADVRRIEIEGEGGDRIVIEHRKDRWQVVEPVDALADGIRIEALIRQLKDLRPWPGSETLSGSAATFGLDGPHRTVRLFGDDPDRPIVALDLGKTVDDRRYVRTEGQEGIEAVDARLLAALDQPAVDWRQTAIFSFSSFEVEEFTVSGTGRQLEARRAAGQWRLLKPIRALADNAQVEETLADLTALEVAEGPAGFVAEGVRDLGPYGLDKPTMTITLTPPESRGDAESLEVGKDVPDRPGLAYARIAGQDDVLQLSTRSIRDLGTKVSALRSRRVADLDLARVDFLKVRVGDDEHVLSRAGAGWQLIKPIAGMADAQTVRDLLTRINDLQTGDFLDPAASVDKGLDPPRILIEVWQGGVERKEAGKSSGAEPKGEPVLTLRLGRRESLAKMVYAQTEGDPAILVVPDAILELLPSGPLAFFERTLLGQDPAQVARIAIRRGGTTYEVQAGSPSGDYEQWRMTRPVDAPAEAPTVARLAVMLARLRVESLIADESVDLGRYGLDDPDFLVTWTSRPRSAGAGRPPEEWTLAVGKSVHGKQGSRYARLAGKPIVFVLNAVAVQYLEAELHRRRVWEFEAQRVSRLAVRQPGQGMSYRNLGVPRDFDWAPEPGSEAAGIALDRLSGLATALSALTAVRFTQYGGPLPPESGLEPAGLDVEVLIAGDAPRRLRLGRPTPEGLQYATIAPGHEGAVFLVPQAHWAAWSPPQTAGLPVDLPEDVFAPTPSPPR